ncbi:MAG: ribonuclease Z [Nanoarchaeota archaeon]
MKGRFIILGTSSAIPTKERNHSAIYFQYKNNSFLFDCGEGTQRQIQIANLSFFRIEKIFISHLHGDHTLGLPGLLQTLDFHDKDYLEIYGPKGIKELINLVPKCFYLNTEDLKINVFELEELAKNNNREVNQVFKVFEDNDFIINSIKLNHTVNSFAYSFKEKSILKIDKEKISKLKLSSLEIKELIEKKEIIKGGKEINLKDISYLKKGFKFTYIADTYYTENIFKIAKDSDYLIIECTYFNENDLAKEYKHLSFDIFKKEIYPKLKELNVKNIILTHFSRRYKDLSIFEEEIKRSKMKNVYLAYDFMKFEF